MCMCILHSISEHFRRSSVKLSLSTLLGRKQIVILLTKLLIFGPSRAGGRSLGRLSDVCVRIYFFCGGGEVATLGTRPGRVRLSKFNVSSNACTCISIGMRVCLCVCIFNVSLYLLGRHFYLQSQTQILNMLVNLTTN